MPRAVPAVPLIVVIDDEPAITDMLSELFSEEGYRVVCCRKDDQALGIIREVEPDVVILDLLFAHPGMGWTILRQMRQDLALALIPVIGCTADMWLCPGQAQQLHALRCDLVFKPFDLDDLLAKVAGFVASSLAACKDTLRKNTSFEGMQMPRPELPDGA
jgi:two-component system, OmpR family, response regulator MtrA